MIKTYTEAVIYLAARLKKQLPDICVKADAEAASKKLSLEQFLVACEMYLDSGAEFYPNNIQKVLELVLKPVSNEDKSSQLAALLLKAIGDYGQEWSTSPTFQTYILNGKEEFGATYRGLLGGQRHFYLKWEHAAESVFGIEGLAIVNRYGGWHRYCEIENESPDGVIRQQTTKLAQSLLNAKDKTGSFGVAPSLSSGGPVVVNLLDFKIKTIESVK